jgi:HK97 family phage prohead protease
MPGAFHNSILHHLLSKSIKLLWQHHPDEPIGTISNIKEDAHGLFIEAKLIFAIQKAKEAYELIKAGALCSLSIGYNVVKERADYEKNQRILEEIDLWEISIVTFPANSLARIESVKSAEKGREYGEKDFQHLVIALERAEVAMRQ